MADFLLELLSEEIPARMQARARADLQRMMAEALQGAALGHGAITAFSTPRRLALIVRDVAAGTEALSEEIKGPRTSAPPQALDGFLRKAGLAKDQLEDRDGIWFARIDRPGKTASAIIGEAVSAIIADFPWPKSMRWGDGELRWVRPLHSIVALLGEEIVPIEAGGISSGATTLGHRFHHPGPITIGGAGDYAEKLRACHVLVDQAEREALIRDGAAKVAAEAGLALIEDEGLVVENAGLTEWPVPLLGQFDPDFLDVPREVIVLTMRTNQKYFACAGADGGLAPAFVCVANIDAKDGGASIVEGNRRVLAARLADARFFWEQDVKVPLEEQAKKLDGIVFHEKLGTVADKVERVAKLARWLIEEGIVKPCSPAKAGTQPGPLPSQGHISELAEQAERAAELCKADLVTGMVGEFPELQGVIGGHLAREQGEDDAVADAIRDHYKPVGQGDEVPTAPVTVAVSLADKLDTLVGFFAIGEKPTGSKDPFALRRLMLGVINTIQKNRLRIPLGELAVQQRLRIAENLADYFWPVDVLDELDINEKSILKDGDDWSGEINFYPREASKYNVDDDPECLVFHENYDSTKQPPFTLADEGTLRDLFSGFVMDRLRVRFRETGIRHDVVSAVLPRDWRDQRLKWLADDLLGELLGDEVREAHRGRYVPSDDILGLEAVAIELDRLLNTQDGEMALAVYKRATKILADEKIPADFEFKLEVGAPEEMMALTRWIEDAEAQIQLALAVPTLASVVKIIAGAKPLLDAFFDNVTVNDSDPVKRAARLGLLARVSRAMDRVADFSKIEG